MLSDILTYRYLYTPVPAFPSDRYLKVKLLYQRICAFTSLAIQAKPKALLKTAYLNTRV